MVIGSCGVGDWAIIQLVGSMRDQEVIVASDAHDLAMVFIGVRYWHH